MEKIFLYTKDSEKAKKTEEFCRHSRVSFRKIEYSELTVPIGQLVMGKGSGNLGKNFGNKNEASENGNQVPPFYVQPEIMILSGMDTARLDKFLDEYKAAVGQVRLKATVTPFNVSWSTYELSRELMKEDKAMANMSQKKA